MLEQTNLIGAIVAHVIYISSILTFVCRLLGRVEWGKSVGYALLLTMFPLGYLLLKALQLDRPALYTVQVILMILVIVMLFLLDYALQVDFRQTRWATISFVVFFFAGTGGMLGVAAEAGADGSRGETQS